MQGCFVTVGAQPDARGLSVSPGIPGVLFTAAVQALGCSSGSGLHPSPTGCWISPARRCYSYRKGPWCGGLSTPLLAPHRARAISAPGTGFQERVATQKEPAASLEAPWIPRAAVLCWQQLRHDCVELLTGLGLTWPGLCWYSP